MPPRDADTESRILEAAHRVFVRRGTAGARTQEIADEAGVNKALLHYYFRSKERLGDAVFLRAAATLFPRMLDALGSDRPLADKLRDAVAVEMDVLDARPYLPGYVLSELRADPDRLKQLVERTVPLDRMRGAVLAGLQAQLDAEAAAGRLRPVRAEAFLVTFLSLLVFPYAAAHVIEVVMGVDADGRARLAAWRRAELPALVLRAFAP